MIKRTFIQILFLGLVSAFSTGCSSTPSVSDSAPAGSCKMLFPIASNIHPEFKEGDRVEVLKKYAVGQRIANFIACNLQEEKYSVVKPIRLQVLISDFRLRSSSSAMWNGTMAGVDRLAVHISVQPEAGEKYDFKNNSGTSKGGLFSSGEVYRIERMGKDLAEKIVKEIENQGYIKK